MKKFLNEFKEFAVKGNMLDLAVGIIIGTAFNKVVNSLVTDIVLPPIGLLLNKVDFSNLYVSLDGSYPSLAAAQQAGVPTLNYGLFLDTILTFVITAFAVFLIIKQINLIRRRREAGVEKDPSPITKQCDFCCSTIPLKATRCPQCTSELKSVSAA